VLEEYRNQIDEIDLIILEELEKRFRVAEKIAELKEEEGLPIESQQREEEVRANISTNASPDLEAFVLAVFDAIISETKNYQEILIDMDE